MWHFRRRHQDNRDLAMYPRSSASMNCLFYHYTSVSQCSWLTGTCKTVTKNGYHFQRQRLFDSKNLWNSHNKHASKHRTLLPATQKHSQEVYNTATLNEWRSISFHKARKQSNSELDCAASDLRNSEAVEEAEWLSGQQHDLNHIS